MNENNVLARLAKLKSASLSEIRAEWKSLFGKEAPPYSKGFLEARVAYRIQELSFGGITEETKRYMRRLQENYDVSKNGKNIIVKPPIGTVLIREWKETEHRVRVVVTGFEYAGREYRSLSAIARQITGTNWNGPMFFGLRSERKG